MTEGEVCAEVGWLSGDDQFQVWVIGIQVMVTVSSCEPGRILGNVVHRGDCDRHEDRRCELVTNVLPLCFFLFL